MKKILKMTLTLALALVLFLSLSACGDADTSGKSKNGEKSADNDDQAVKEVALGYYEAIKDARLKEAKAFTQEDCEAAASIEEMITFMAFESVKKISPEAAEGMREIYRKFLGATSFEIEKIEVMGESAQVIMMTNSVETNKAEMEKRYSELVEQKIENQSPEEKKAIRQMTEAEQLNVGLQLGLQAWEEIFDEIIGKMKTVQIKKTVELEKDDSGWKIVSVG